MEERYQSLFRGILIIFIFYCIVFIYKTSFVINGQRHFSLADDQMISMKYAKNFANGHGLVWNKGTTRVEGYTNLLWVLYMAIFHAFLVPPSKVSLFIQISGLLLLIFNLFTIRKIGSLISSNSSFVCITSVIFTAFYFPLNYWSLHGFEVSLLVLLINLSVLFVIQSQRLDKFSFVPYLLLGIGTLVRLDMVVPYLMVLIYQFTLNKKNRVQYIFSGLIPLACFIAGQTLFRYYYYGELLPNTYYLKMTGYPVFLRISRGFLVFLDFIWKANWVLFLLPIVLVFFRKYKFINLLFLIILGQIFYSIYVGGDAWERQVVCNRFIVLGMPLFFVLFSLSVFEIFNYIKQTLRIESKSIQLRIYLFLFLLFSLFSFNSLRGVRGATDWLLSKPILHVSAHRKKLELGLHIEKVTRPEAKVAVTWAGTMPYFVDRHYVDFLGRNDKKIARLEMKTFDKSTNLFSFNNITNSKYTFFFPGHLKWDYSYSFGRLKPDVITTLWVEPEKATPYLKGEYVLGSFKDCDYRAVFRKNSKNINWDKIELQSPSSEGRLP